MRTSRFTMAATGLGAALIVTGCGGSAAVSPPGSNSVVPSSTATAAVTRSQSPADAARDGVIPALARLPFKVRVHVLASVRTPEGVWAISRPSAEAKRYTVGCRLGPEAGKYPTNTICTTDYGELLLLDRHASTIERAYPLPAVPPTMLEVTKDAVYCGRSGDRKLSETALPDAMVCRVDRSSLKARVHVFAPPLVSEVRQPCFYPPKNWTVTNGRMNIAALQPTRAALIVKGRHATATLDPMTLAVR